MVHDQPNRLTSCYAILYGLRPSILTAGWRLETGDWRLPTEDWRLETAYWRLETGDCLLPDIGGLLQLADIQLLHLHQLLCHPR